MIRQPRICALLCEGDLFAAAPPPRGWHFYSSTRAFRLLTLHSGILLSRWLALAGGHAGPFGLAFSSVVAYHAFPSSGAGSVYLYIDDTEHTKKCGDGVMPLAGSIFVLSIMATSRCGTSVQSTHCPVLVCERFWCCRAMWRLRWVAAETRWK